MSQVPRLVQLSYSPWSERARWGLDHHRIAYRTAEHVPFLGELGLRRIVGDRKAKATVPVLIDGDNVLVESWDIVTYADGRGSGSQLIPASLESEIRASVALADEACKEGRALVLASLLASPAAQDESLTLPVPQVVKPAMRPVTRFALSWFARKYGSRIDALPQARAALRVLLDKVRARLGASRYVLGQFTYADIAIATCLQGVSPVGNGYIRIGPATRRAWTLDDLAADYADLIRWRDQIYASHRGVAAQDRNAS